MSDDLFRWVIAAGVLLCSISFIAQAVIIALTYRTVKQGADSAKDIQKKITPLIEKITPLLDRTDLFISSGTRLIEDNRARVAQISTETLAVAKTAHEQADHISDLLDDVNQRTRHRLDQVDRTIEETVVQVEQMRDTVRSAVNAPIKEVNGIVAGIRAGVAAYARGGRRHSIEHVTQDEEMFI
jgi:hypothetical protein